MNWIDEIVEGLLDYYQTNNMYDIYKQLNIRIERLDKSNILLQGNEAVYHRFNEQETVYCSNDIVNEEFVLAHELGHAILHVDEDVIFYNPTENKGKLELEANYFAVKLLYHDYELEDGIETRQQLSNRLMINEDLVDYVLK